MTFRVWTVDSVTGPDCVAFCGGGDVLPGMPFSACHAATVREKQLDFAALCRATRIQVGTIRISTVELIHYVANALGGAHFDPQGKAARRPKADLLRRLEAGEIAGVPLRVNDRSLLHHELLSIVQAILRSPEVGRLRDAPLPA